MTLRKWFFLFMTCMGIGGLVTVVTGLIMQWTDQSFGFMGIGASGFNAGMMLLSGLMIGAFSHMGFFAYLTLNYIAMSVFRKQYLWNALQAYTTLFSVVFFGYLLYEQRDSLGNVMFWALPLLLAAGSWIVGFFKTKQTSKSALIPTLFLTYVVTIIEMWPSLNGQESNPNAVIFMLLPLFACNAYQIMMLHRVLKPQETGAASNANPVS